MSEKAVVNKKLVKVKGRDGVEVELAVVRPNHKQQQSGQMVYASAFRQAVDGGNGAIVGPALENVLRKQGIWDDAKQAAYDELQKKLIEGERKIVEGGFKLSEAYKVAVQMRRDRVALTSLLRDRNALQAHTAESQAEQARFQHLLVACTVYSDTGKPYWQSEDEYVAEQDTEAAEKAGFAFGNILYRLDEDFSKKLPENKFLVKYKFANADLHLIDKQGRLIDADGRLVNKDGRYVNDKGEYVDADGNLLTEEGDFKVEFKPFLDDSGLPVQD